MAAPTCSAEATPAKEAGNKAFREGKFEEAHQHFSEAIRLDGKSALLRSNRAGALSSLGRHAEALADAEVCTLLQADWWKGFSRRGKAQFDLDLYAEAEASFQEALKLNPQEKSVAESLQRAVLRRQEKEKGGGSSPLRAAGSAGQAASAPSAPSAPSAGAAGAASTDTGGEFQRVSGEQVNERLRRGLDQLSDAELDAELRNAGMNLPEDASRAVKARLYLDISQALQAQANGVLTGPQPLKQDYDTEGAKVLDMRKRWLEEWSTWDDEQIKGQLRKRGFDAEGLCRADLIDLLLRIETDRAQRKTCTPQRLQLCGAASASILTLGTFLIVAAVFTS